MNKKYQSKLEDIEKEVDSQKKVKKSAPKKRGLPVITKDNPWHKAYGWKSESDKDWEKFWNEEDEIDVPLHLRGGEWKWNFEEKKMPLADKITWVLTAVNVAILISIIIKNV